MAGFNKGYIQSMYSDMVIATRAIGASSEQTQGALLALEQMISKGVVSMEELRRQLGNAVPGAFEIGAKAMNMTTKEFNEFVKTGQLASAEFVPKFIAEFKRQYADCFKEISQTVDFATGQLKESYEELSFTIMHGAIGKGLAKLINGIDKAVRALNRTLEILNPVLEYLVNVFGHLWWLIMPFVLGGALNKLVAGIKTIVTWLAAGNLQLSKTQIMLFRLMIFLALLQEILAFFTSMDGALETAILGKDQSWLKRFAYFMAVLLPFLLLLLKLKGAKVAAAAGGAATGGAAGGGAATGGAAASGAATGVSVSPLGGIVAGLGASAATVWGANKWMKGLDTMSLSPYGAATLSGMPHQITFYKEQPVQQSIMYSPQYKIDATTMTPEQLRNILDEHDRNFWTSIASPSSVLRPNFAGGNN